MRTVRGWIAALDEFDALVLTSLVWFLGKSVRYAFPPLFETFRGEYGVSNTTLGLLFTGLMIAYAAMQFPSGALGDRIGTVRVITAGALVLSGGALLLATSQVLAALVVAVILIGVGSGIHKTVAINLLSVVYPRRTGRALGVMDAIGSAGGVVAPAAVVFVLSTALGWPVLFLAGGIIGIALAATFYVRMASRPEPDDRGAAVATDSSDGDVGSGETYLSSFLDIRFVLFVAATVAFTFAWNGLNAFLPLYLVTDKALSSSRAGLLYSALFLASLVQPVTGALGDRLGELRMIVGTVGLAGASLGLLLVAEDAWLVAGLIPLVGIGVHGFRPLRDAYLVRLIPTSVGGGTLGIVRTLMMAAGAAAPAIVGYLSEAANFTVAFGALVAAIGVSLAVVTVLMAVGSRGIGAK